MNFARRDSNTMNCKLFYFRSMGFKPQLEDFLVYNRRRDHQIKEAEYILKKFRNQVRFIEAISSGSIQLSQLPDSEIDQVLSSLGFDRLPTKSPAAGKDDDNSSAENSSFSYLYRMSLLSLSQTHANKLRNDLLDSENELAALQKTSAENLWISDLDRLSDYISKTGSLDG